MKSPKKSTESGGSKRAARTRPSKARLLLCIEEAVYFLIPLAPDKSVAQIAWRMVKAGSRSEESYDICFTEFGPSCECGAAVYRNEACKHVRACRAVGLLPKE